MIRLARRGRMLRVLDGDPGTLAMLRLKLSVPHPSAAYIRKSVPYEMDWDGREHFFDVYSDNDDGTVGECGLGLADRVERILRKERVKFERQFTTDSGLVLTQELARHGKFERLSQDQLDASEALIGTDTGCIELDVSSGKSYIVLNLMASALKQRPDWKFCLLVPRKALLYQIFKEAQQALPHLDVGILGDGHRQFLEHSITIATAATATAGGHIKGQKIILDWLKQCDVIAVDEAHHSNAETWKAVYRHARASVLWGVSAKFTFGTGKKIQERALEACFGPPRYKGEASDFRVPVKAVFYTFGSWRGRTPADVATQLVDGTPAVYRRDGKRVRGVYRGLNEDRRCPSDLRDEAGKADKSLYGIWTDGEKVENPEDVVYYTASDIGLMEFRRRDEWAVRIAVLAARRKEIFLITASRDRHVRKLEKACGEANLVVERLDGSVTSGQFEKIVARWKAKEIHGVVAQHGVVSEGLSIPSLHHLIKLDGLAGEMLLHQQKGRPARVESGKKCGYLHIPYDVQHKSLEKNSRAMITYYASQKLEIIEIGRASEEDINSLPE